MRDNVVQFDEFENELQISTQQSELPCIVLEGGDDVALFRRWFFTFMDRLEFVQASNEGVGSGCTAVRMAVDSLRSRGVRAFGLSDRDSLFKEANWPVLFSVDDGEFAAATREPHLAVNSLWEIEAYLLDPQLIPNWVRAHQLQAPASVMDTNAALSRVVEECENLLKAQPWLATAHRCGQAVPDGKYCTQPTGEFSTRCSEELEALVDEHGTAPAVETHVTDVLERAPDHLPDRLRWLLRYVDTKRLMLRIKQRLRLVNARHKWVLAELMEVAGLKPTELEERVSALSQCLNS